MSRLSKAIRQGEQFEKMKSRLAALDRVADAARKVAKWSSHDDECDVCLAKPKPCSCGIEQLDAALAALEKEGRK